MSEPTTLGALDSELRRYFAATTSTELPRRVGEMSARTLSARRRPIAALLAGATGVLATAALVVVIATHAGSPGGVTSGTSRALQKGAGAPAAAAPQLPAPFPPAVITDTGIDTNRLAASGTLLLRPGGHGTALVPTAQAQAAAAASLGAQAETPGPAVLTYAELSGRPQATTCLCWAVDVPVRGTVTQSTNASSTLRTELVLVDAVTGRVTATLAGNGIP
jgi:hypothetical protein